MNPAISVVNLEVPFGAQRGLSDLNFDIQPGASLTLLGPSGVGKSSLLRALAGLIPIREGSMTVNGRDVTFMPPHQRGVVYLHQKPLLFPHMSVVENVLFPLRIRGIAAQQARITAMDLLDAVNLPGLAQRAPSSLSGGQQQRVALARAIAAEPVVLLLDEPYNALEPAMRDEMRRLITTLQQQHHFALILVTHDLDDAAHHAEQVGVLLDGAIRQMSSLRQLLRHPADPAVAEFVGIRNRIEGMLSAEGILDSAIGPVRVHAGTILPGPAVAMFPASAVALCKSDTGAARLLSVAERADRTLIAVELNGARLEAIGDPTDEWSPGMAVSVRIDPAQILLFRQADRATHV